MYNGPIIDTHMHLWDLKNNYPWLNTHNIDLEKLIGNYDKLRKNFLVEDYLRLTKEHNVVKSVHLQALGFPENPVLETKWLQEQSNEFGFPNAIIAYASLADSNVEDILQKHCEYKNMRGIRMPLNFHDEPYLRFTDRPDYMQDSQWKKGFSLLHQYNLLFEFHIYDHQLIDVASLAKEFPNTTMIIEHFAWPLDLSDSGFKRWKQSIIKVAKYQNVFIKLSGLGCSFKRSPIDTINRYIHTAIDSFSTDRCMFGSNCPPDTLFYTFDEIMRIFKQAFSSYTKDEQSKLFFENAKKVYRL